MFHLPSTKFIYSSYQVIITFNDGNKSIERKATGFVISLKNNTPYLVTNRHVIDLNFNDTTGKYKDFRVSTLTLLGVNEKNDIYKIKMHPAAKVYFHSDENNDVVLILGHIYLESATFHWHFDLQ